MTFTISQKGLDFIKNFEGLKLKVYLCPAGKRTIGYGHVLGATERYNEITKETAENLFKEDVKAAEYVVNKAVTAPLTQDQYDAIVSLVFNWGGSRFLRSRGLKKLNNSDYAGASVEFKDVIRVNGVKSAGLIRRRNEEFKNFTDNISYA